MSRGLTNCNPGNIRLSAMRYKGEIRPSRDPEFRCFETMAFGYRAMFVLLHTYARRHRCRTLRHMIERYAPPSENPTDDYLRFVAHRSAVGADDEVDTLDRETMTAIAAAMSAFENGSPADHRALAEGWQLFAADFSK